MTTTDGFISRFRQPEYTGENRCIPCTVVNSIIAVVGSAIVAVGVGMRFSPGLGIGAGVIFLSISAVLIYLRGYLVPKTPELTKQYFPPWLLELFGKEPEHTQEMIDTEIDPEETLMEAGALEECEDIDDLCLTDSFRERWYDEIQQVDTADAGRDQLLQLLDLDEGEIEYDEFGPAFQAKLDGQVVGKWESEAAFLADLGAARSLEQAYTEWSRLPLEAKSQLLNGLRLFIDTCPSCGGIPEFGSETVESCCSTYEVAAVSCQECESRLFESRVNV